MDCSDAMHLELGEAGAGRFDNAKQPALSMGLKWRGRGACIDTTTWHSSNLEAEGMQCSTGVVQIFVLVQRQARVGTM